MTMDAVPPASTGPQSGWLHLGIVIEGVLTLGAVLLILPLGIALIVVNAVLAVATRGMNRKLFACFAIAGAVLCLVVSMSLWTASFG